MNKNEPQYSTLPNNGGWSAPAPVLTTGVPVIESKPKNSFKPDVYDFCFAVTAFILGYLFSRWVFFSWLGWGVAFFTTVYLATATIYLHLKGNFIISRETWFWFFITFLTGMSYALFDNPGLSVIRAFFLFSASIYYVLIASGHAIGGHTTNYLFIDGLNTTLFIPFRNFLNQYVSFSFLKKEKKKSKFLPVFIGTLIACFLSAILIPLLLRADSGGFRMLLSLITENFSFLITDFIFYAFFAVPFAAYMYGLISGSAHKKGTSTIKREYAEGTVRALRFVPVTTITVIFGTICLIYLTFILSQIPYFFSAFSGNRPEGWLVYSEYARKGFFELCAIAAINLTVLTIFNITSKKQRIESRLLKILNIILAVITLVLIATAFSKMALYIDAYGLTMLRLLPCIFMVFLAIVFIAFIALQKWNFSIVRLSLLTGAVMICILCLSNPDALVVRYNTNRFLEGTLREYDVSVLYRAGNAGVQPALDVLEQTNDMKLSKDISHYINYQTNRILPSYRHSLESFLAREKVSEKDS